jgi:hypothetical protein
VCAIESARYAHPRCHGATMRLMCDTNVAAGVLLADTYNQQLNKLRGVSLLGIRQERGELGRGMTWGH